MQTRAYAVLTIKRVDADQRVIEGIASTPQPDRVGDIVDPMGAKFTLPMPLLLHHRHDEPVGHVTFAKATKDGIPFVARIAEIAEPGKLKDRVDEAWQSVKAKLIRGVSIGFKALEHELMPSGGIRFKAWEWLELSLVVVPANAEATIQTIKAIDTAQPSPVAMSDTFRALVDTAWDNINVFFDETKQGMSEPGKLIQYTKSRHIAFKSMLAEMLASQRQYRDAITALAKRVAELEQQKASSGLVYRGVYEEGEEYHPGSFVTLGGSMWCAKALTRAKPGTDGSWQLAIKRGRDGRHAPR